MHEYFDFSNSKYRAIYHVCGEISNCKYRATYCMYVVMLVIVSIGLHTACIWCW